MNLANKISIFRILLTPFFVLSIMYYRPEQDFLRFIALGIFSLGVISDGVDGYIARIGHQKSRLGILLDPMADKLLLMTVFICLSMANNLPAHLRLPPWVPIVVISRDIIIVLGAAIIYLITSDLQIAPSWLGKLTTFFQMSTIIAVLTQYKYSPFILNIAMLFTVISGIDYIRRGSKLLNESR